MRSLSDIRPLLASQMPIAIASDPLIALNPYKIGFRWTSRH